MKWNVPNQLTVGRIVLSAAFFVLLGACDPASKYGPWLLNVAFVMYIVAGITDILDGYLARKWNQTSAFGRIVDPFVDKVLVVGAFAMLAGANYAHSMDVTEHVRQFLNVGDYERSLPQWLTGGMFSAVQSWMVVVVMAREFIVSAVRGYSESQGIKFPATYAGKIKMLVQSVAICTVLYQMANVQTAPWAVWTKIICIWVAVIVTVLSGFAYVQKARHLLLGGGEDQSS